MPIDIVTPETHRTLKCNWLEGKLTRTYLKLGTNLSPIFSVGLLRGFAYCPAMRPIRITGVREPQMRIREKERINPIFAVMFSYGCHLGDIRKKILGTHVGASFKTLCTVPSVEEERFVLLDLGELVLQPLDLPRPAKCT